MQLSTVPTEKVRAGDNPRGHADESAIVALSKNIAKNGQQVPIIVYAEDDGFTLVDGHRRLKAAIIANVKTMSAVIEPEKPTADRLLLVQMSLDVHRVGLSPFERSAALLKYQKSTGYPITRIADDVGVTQSFVTKLLALQKLHPDIQQTLQTDAFDLEKAYTISQEPDFEKQKALAREAKSLSRDQLRRRVREMPAKPEVRTDVARFAVDTDVTVIVQGNRLTLGRVIEVLSSTGKELRRGLTEGLDVTTQQRVMRDRVNAGRPAKAS